MATTIPPATTTTTMNTTPFTIDINQTLYHVNVQQFEKSMSIYIDGNQHATVTYFYNSTPTFDDKPICTEILQHNRNSPTIEDIVDAIALVTKKPVSLLLNFDQIDPIDALYLKNALLTQIRTIMRGEQIVNFEPTPIDIPNFQ